MVGASRIFSLASTTAVCPTLKRLGALVLQSVLAGWPDVSAAGVGVGVSAVPASDVAVGSTVVGVVVASVVGVSEGPDDVVDVGWTVAASVGTEVGVKVGGRVADSTADGIGDGTMVSVATGGTTVGVDAGVGFVAHPRKSIRIRIATRIKVTINLNRS